MTRRPPPSSLRRRELRESVRRQQVRLGDHDDLRQLDRGRFVRGQLARGPSRSGLRAPARLRRSISTRCSSPAALDVREELVAEAGALRRPLDQPRDVGEDELALAVVDRAERRVDGRERVVGDLRPGPGERRQQRGLAGVRQPDQARRRRAGAGADRSSRTRRSARARRTAAPGGWARRSACCRGHRARRPQPRPAGPARPGHRPAPRARRPSSREAPAPRVLAARAVLVLAAPVLPAPGLEVWPIRSSARSRRDESQTSTTSPPLPPSPPSGPPRGTCASLRKLTQPSPPPPASTHIRALS